MNQYPTLFLSLKDVDGTTFENAFNMLKFVISSLCSQNSYLETGENIRENEKDIFISFCNIIHLEYNLMSARRLK